MKRILLDRQAAIKFFSSVAGRRFVGGSSGSHPESNTKGDQDARLRAILRTLERNRQAKINESTIYLLFFD